MADAPKPPQQGPKGGAAAPAPKAAGIKLTPKQQQNIALAVIILAGAGYAYWTYGYAPKKKEFIEKKAVLEQKEKEYKEAVDMANKYEEFKTREVAINKKVDFMNRRLPKTFEMSSILKSITEAATEADLRIFTFTPDAKEENKGAYKESKIKIDFDTNYANLGKFLTRIGYIERLIAPSGIKIEAMEKARTNVPTDNIKVSMNIRIFSFIE